MRPECTERHMPAKLAYVVVLVESTGMQLMPLQSFLGMKTHQFQPTYANKQTTKQHTVCIYNNDDYDLIWKYM